MGDNKSLVAVAVIEKVLHDCKFAECEEELPLNQIGNHEKVCKHRVVACPAKHLGCNKKVPLSKLLAHLEKSSNCTFDQRPVVVQGSQVTKYNLSLKEHELQAPRIAWKMKTYCFEGKYVSLRVFKSGG